METTLFYIAPFAKNVAVLCLTIGFVVLMRSITTVGLDGFSLQLWLQENRGRFTAGGLLIFILSALMALADVAPLFKFIGFDINASPVGLGIALATLLLLKPTRNNDSKKVAKVKAIQKDANAIIKKSSEIVKDEASKGEQK